MEPQPVATVIGALDRHVALTEELVRLAQQEQAHLITFEAARLAACVAEKRLTLEALEHTGRAIGEALAAAGGAPTAAALAERLSGPDREAIMERVVCLRALGQSLDELHRMTLVQAQRGVRFVRAYANTLRTTHAGAAAPETGLYGANGRTQREPLATGHVVRSV